MGKALRGHALALSFLAVYFYDSGNCTNEFDAEIPFQIEDWPGWLLTVIKANTRDGGVYKMKSAHFNALRFSYSNIYNNLTFQHAFEVNEKPSSVAWKDYFIEVSDGNILYSILRLLVMYISP